MDKIIQFIKSKISIGDIIKIISSMAAAVIFMLSPLKDNFLRLFYSEELSIEIINDENLDPDRKFAPRAIIEQKGVMPVSPSIIHWKIEPNKSTNYEGSKTDQLNIEKIIGAKIVNWNNIGKISLQENHGEVTITAKITTNLGKSIETKKTINFHRSSTRPSVHIKNFSGRWVVQDLDKNHVGSLTIQHNSHTSLFTGQLSLPGSIFKEEEVTVNGQIDTNIFIMNAVSPDGHQVTFSDHDYATLSDKKQILIKGAFKCGECEGYTTPDDRTPIVIFADYFE
jgi:hypothetical protein